MGLVDIALLISMVLCWGHTRLKEDQIQKLLPWPAASYSSSLSSFFLHVFCSLCLTDEYVLNSEVRLTSGLYNIS